MFLFNEREKIDAAFKVQLKKKNKKQNRKQKFLHDSSVFSAQNTDNKKAKICCIEIYTAINQFS